MRTVYKWLFGAALAFNAAAIYLVSDAPKDQPLETIVQEQPVIQEEIQNPETKEYAPSIIAKESFNPKPNKKGVEIIEEETEEGCWQKAEFVNGEQNGLEQIWCSDVLVRERYYKRGKIDGLERRWYDNGKKASEGRFVDGKREGLWTTWSEGYGHKESETNYYNGKMDGPWTVWHHNGAKGREFNFVNGEVSGVMAWFDENGKKWIEAEFDESGQGHYDVYNENGEKIVGGDLGCKKDNLYCLINFDGLVAS